MPPASMYSSRIEAKLVQLDIVELLAYPTIPPTFPEFSHREALMLPTALQLYITEDVANATIPPKSAQLAELLYITIRFEIVAPSVFPKHPMP